MLSAAMLTSPDTCAENEWAASVVKLSRSITPSFCSKTSMLPPDSTLNTVMTPSVLVLLLFIYGSYHHASHTPQNSFVSKAVIHNPKLWWGKAQSEVTHTPYCTTSCAPHAPEWWVMSPFILPDSCLSGWLIIPTVHQPVLFTGLLLLNYLARAGARALPANFKVMGS